MSAPQDIVVMPVLGSVVENKSVNVHNAKACLSSYILRTIMIVQKAESVDVVLRDWSSRLVPLSTMVNMILDKWDAVRAACACSDASLSAPAFSRGAS